MTKKGHQGRISIRSLRPRGMFLPGSGVQLGPHPCQSPSSECPPCPGQHQGPGCLPPAESSDPEPVLKQDLPRHLRRQPGLQSPKVSGASCGGRSSAVCEIPGQEPPLLPVQARVLRTVRVGVAGSWKPPSHLLLAQANQRPRVICFLLGPGCLRVQEPCVPREHRCC